MVMPKETASFGIKPHDAVFMLPLFTLRFVPCGARILVCRISQWLHYIYPKMEHIGTKKRIPHMEHIMTFTHLFF
jgi:hypothetical protein